MLDRMASLPSFLGHTMQYLSISPIRLLQIDLFLLPCWPRLDQPCVCKGWTKGWTGGTHSLEVAFSFTRVLELCHRFTWAAMSEGLWE